MKRLLLMLFILVSTILTAKSQSTVLLQDPISNKVFNPEKYSGIRGTPFLYDKWTKGSATSPRGTYAELELKFNVYDNTLLYNKDDEPYEFQDEIESFILKPKPTDESSFMLYKKGISGADLRANQFVQVMAEGKLNLYKLDVKLVSEMSEINAGMIKTFTSTAKYYVGANGKLQVLRSGKDELPALMSDKADAIQAYIKEKKLNLRKESDQLSLIKYYNGL